MCQFFRLFLIFIKVFPGKKKGKTYLTFIATITHKKVTTSWGGCRYPKVVNPFVKYPSLKLNFETFHSLHPLVSNEPSRKKEEMLKEIIKHLMVVKDMAKVCPPCKAGSIQ